MFRFTIRDVLWLTVVVALAVGWFLEHRQASENSETIRKARAFGFDIRAILGSKSP